MITKLTLRTAGLSLLAGASLSANAQTLTSYPTSINNYVYIGQAGMNAAPGPGYAHTNNAPSNAITFSTGQPLINVPANVKFNGVGLSQQDGYLYAQSFTTSAAVTSSDFYRIGANQVAVQLGVIPAPPAEAGVFGSVVNVSAGMVDAAGNYWFSAYTLSGNPFVTPYQASQFKMYMGRVANIGSLTPGTSTLTPTYYQLNISDPAIQTAIQNFLTYFNYAAPANSYGGIQDFAASPTDGKFYGMFSYPTANYAGNFASDNPSLNHRPVVVDPATWTATVVGTTINTSPTRNELAGTYFTPSGSYYAIFTSGQYSQVNLTTGALINLMMSNLPTVTDPNVPGKQDLRGDLASNTNATPLATPLASFTGRADGYVNRLEWTGSASATVSRYIIERSADGRRFETIGTMQADGAVRHTFNDETPLAMSMYRIRSVDAVGDVAISSIVRIATAQGGAATVAPTLLNGSQSTIRIMTSTASADVVLTDLTGRSLISNTLVNAGNNVLEMALPNLVPGQYLLRVRNSATGEELITERIQKQ